MSTPKEMPLTLSTPTIAPVPDPLRTGLCALTRLNADTCWSAFICAAVHWESLLRAQTPEHFIRRQTDVVPWLALQFADYTRGWMDIVSETTRVAEAFHDRDDGPEAQAVSVPAGIAADATAGDAMPREVEPLQVQAQAQGESVAEPQADALELTRAILLRAAKADPATAKPQNPRPARRSSTR